MRPWLVWAKPVNSKPVNGKPVNRRQNSDTHRSRLRPGDAVLTGTHGLRARKGRTTLTALGIAIGIASMIAVIGISASSRADLLAQIDALGTDLLRVETGQTVFGEAGELPVDAPAMVRRIAPVRNAATVTSLATTVQRSRFVSTRNALDVLATESQLLDTVEGTMRTGRWLEDGEAALPVVVLGSEAAYRLGIDSLHGAPTVSIARQRFAVTGILNSLPLHEDLNRSALITGAAATELLGAEVVPTTILLRADPRYLEQVRSVLPRTVDPADPREVAVSRPSDALEARAEVDQNLQNLLLGLGGVALLVGGVGIANVMIISVLERRGEIGLRRALGATRRHIAMQFVVESAGLAAIGGVLGVIVGGIVTAVYADRQGWLIDLPVQALGLGVAAALLIGAVAGLHPAVRAARLDPAEAVRPR